jgi:hypothetical protein
LDEELLPTDAAAIVTGGTGMSKEEPPSMRDFLNESVAKINCFLDKSTA